MNGTVKTYLPEKQYGFIKGDDGKDYFFHESEFIDKKHIAILCEEVNVCFQQQATPKGYKAKNCVVVDAKEITTFIVPDEFVTSRSNAIQGWDIIEHGNWMVYGSSRDSPDQAKINVIENSMRIGANGLVNMEYYKTTGSERGSGHGTHYYTIHNFRGRVVTVGKRRVNGGYSKFDLQGLNERAEFLKRKLAEKTSASEHKNKVLWLVILLFSILSIAVAPLFIIFLLIIGYIFGGSDDYDWWIERIRS